MTRPVIVDYNPRWPQAASEVIAELSRATRLPGSSFQHIGSTAIPGMAAKDIIDVQAQVPNLAAFARAAGEGLGSRLFRQHQEIIADNPPVWWEGPEPTVGWEKLLWSRRAARLPDVNLHVRLIDSPNSRLALLFRDFLRAHPPEVAAYSAFKRALAQQVPDTGTYSDIKDPVVHLVIAEAARWARRTDWEPAR